MLQVGRLSDREIEIIKKIAEGHRSRDIAQMLVISPYTVQTHRRNIMRKLKVHNCTSAVSICMKLKWI
jgi:DNA-binding CsgD family transcriptional regulator